MDSVHAQPNIGVLQSWNYVNTFRASCPSRITHCLYVTPERIRFLVNAAELGKRNDNQADGAHFCQSNHIVQTGSRSPPTGIVLVELCRDHFTVLIISQTLNFVHLPMATGESIRCARFPQ